MKEKYHYQETWVKWVYTVMSNVLGDFSRTTVEFVPKHSRHSHHPPKPWRLYRCRTCGFMTHATQPLPKSTLGTDGRLDLQMAIVRNIPVVDSVPADYTGSGLLGLL